jgi:hypothetical protein
MSAQRIPAQLAIPTSQRSSGLGPPELTTYQGIEPNSTQKTSLIDEGCPLLICYAPPTSIFDVGLKLTISPVTHRTQLHITQPRVITGRRYPGPESNAPYHTQPL